MMKDQFLQQKNFRYRDMKKQKLRKGNVLISEPNMKDPNFKRSVILITEHNEKESVGFIINQPTKMSINDLIDEFPPFDAPIHIGGPVRKDTLHFIHSLGSMIDGAIQISENLYWGGNFQTLTMLVKNDEIKLTEIRFFMGYSGWGLGQLEDEIKKHSWIVAAANNKLILSENNEVLWKDFIGAMDEKYAVWINMPDDPSLN